MLIRAQMQSRVANRFGRRYGLPVAANSATGFDDPNRNRRHSAQDPIASAFFVPAMSFYGGCAWEDFGPAGFRFPRFVNPRTAATPIRLTTFGGSSKPEIGASPYAAFTRTKSVPRIPPTFSCNRLIGRSRNRQSRDWLSSQPYPPTCTNRHGLRSISSVSRRTSRSDRTCEIIPAA